MEIESSNHAHKTIYLVRSTEESLAPQPNS